MANFNAAALTKKGISLLAKAQAGLTNIELTKAASGSGPYEDGEQLSSMEALKEQKQEFPINKISVVNDATVFVKFVITNELETGNLQEGYYVKEVGIFANDPDEGEILYAIATAVEDQWDYMPAYNGLLPAAITVEFYTEVSNAESVTIKSSGAFITKEDAEAEFERINSSIQAIIAGSALVENELVLPASGWMGTGAPFSNTLQVAGVTESSAIHVALGNAATLAQAERWMEAGMLNGTQAAGSITLRAYGKKPAIDIPVKVSVQAGINGEV